MAKRIGLGLLVILVVGGVGLYLGRGALMPLAMRAMAPSGGFDPAVKAAAPDYASAEAWLARPETQDLADYVPTGVEAGQATDVAAGAVDPASRRVDVFFVHPTTYLRGEDWNDPARTGTSTEENTRWVLANQASAFNGCCNVYAPRYRQASIYSFIPAEGAQDGRQALDFAYQDVARAFDHFVTEISKGRPFILAGHSQGTIHLRRLLREKVSGTPLAQRMVAAYLLGGGVNVEELAAMSDLHACQSATDLNCVVHWATYGPEGRALEFDSAVTTLCTNPLTWTVDAEPAAANLNLGAVVPSGAFAAVFWGTDRAQGIQFEPLAEPLVGYVGAQCKDERLVVDPQEDSAFARYTRLGRHNYHGLDYALFYMNIRANAQARVAAYLASAPPAAPGA